VITPYHRTAHATHTAHPAHLRRTYRFETPRWQPARRLHTQTLGLIGGTLVWVGLYSWLAYRLWSAHAPLASAQSLGQAAALIVLGVAVGVAWWWVGKRWLARLRPAAWRALSLEQMMDLTPPAFEQYVAERIFARQGYDAVNTPDVKDGGIDILLTDREGRRAVVQCKRYRGTVGAETVRDLYGTMIHSGAAHAYLVTTGSISRAAREWAAGKNIELLDGERLVELARSLPNQERDDNREI
jgi:restriction system protein